MAEDEDKGKRQNDVQVRCALACVRAGLAILIFSAFAFSIVGPIEKMKEFASLKEYFEDRFLLQGLLDDLNTDLYWNAFIQTPEGAEVAEHWTLDRLAKRTFEFPIYRPEGKKQNEKTVDRKTPETTTGIPTPAPPTNIRMVGTLWQLESMGNVIEKLFSPEFLNHARQFSWQFYGPIRRWDRFISCVMMANCNGLPFGFLAWHSKFFKRKIVEPIFSFKKDDMMRYLTLPDLKKISEYEMPKLQDLESMNKEIDRLLLPNFGGQLSMLLGSFLIQSVICICLLYFFLFQKS